MSLLPASPRRRRRLFWLTVVVLVAGSIAATVELLPETHPAREVFSNQPAQVSVSDEAKLSPADRRRIDSIVDRFLVAALNRSDPKAAWALAGPDLRGSSTAADWVAGAMPIPRYIAKGSRFDEWTLVDVGRDRVSFSVNVQPRAGTKAGPLALSMEVIRRGRSWVVNRAYPAASFTPVGEKPRVVGPQDFNALGRGESTADHRRVGGSWLVVPAALLALGVLAAALLLSRGWLSRRRVRRRSVATGATAIPTLPLAYRDQAPGRSPEG